MASLSIIADARARLVDMVTDLAGGVQVSYGMPPAEQQQRELVALLSSSTATVEDPHLKDGRRARYEDFDNLILVLVASQPTPRDAEARATEIGSAVEDLLADDPKLDNVDGLIAAWLTARTFDSGFGPEGVPVCALEMTVRMKARLT